MAMSCGPMRAHDPELSDDAILDGRLRLLQPKSGHRFGHDAILLAAAVPAEAGAHVMELGAGVGAAALALLARVAGTRLTLVEIDPALAALAQQNIARNGFGDRACVLTRDVGALARDFSAAGLEPQSADHVMMNPPFNDPAHQASPHRGRRQAHHGDEAMLPQWIETATRLLRPGGTLTVIWRSEGLAKILAALASGYGGIAMLPIHGRGDAPAIRVIARAVKGSNAPLRLLAALTLTEKDGRPAAPAENVLREGAALQLED